MRLETVSSDLSQEKGSVLSRGRAHGSDPRGEQPWASGSRTLQPGPLARPTVPELLPHRRLPMRRQSHEDQSQGCPQEMVLGCWQRLGPTPQPRDMSTNTTPRMSH